MNVNANDAVLLYLQTGELLPIYRGALQAAEGWPWIFKKKYSGALLIDELGFVKKIVNVKVIGLHGDSRLSKFFSFLNSNWVVYLELSDVFLSFDEIRKLIIEGLIFDKNYNFSKFIYLEKTFYKDVSDINSIKSIFDYLCISKDVLDEFYDEDSSILLDSL